MKTENNKLIAEFMGVKFKDDEAYIEELKQMRKEGIFFEQGYTVSELKYHTSWEWLMPVVGKIVADFEFNKENELQENEYREVIMDVVPFAVIEDTYQAVVEFIKWYNENK